METPVAFCVDDDPSVRSSLKFLIGTAGLDVETFDSAEAALQKLSPETAGCLVVDVRLRGLSGLDLQQRLDSLTAREREVMSMVVAGELNKQIADRPATSENPIKVHRSRVMETLKRLPKNAF